MGGDLLQKAFAETLRLLQPASSAALLVVFIYYVLEDGTYVLGSSIRALAMVASVQRQGGSYRSDCYLKSVAMDELAHRKVKKSLPFFKPYNSLTNTCLPAQLALQFAVRVWVEEPPVCIR